MLASYLGITALSFLTLYLFRKLAPHIGLLDKPNERKTHSGSIPLVGGLTLFTGLFVYFALLSPATDYSFSMLICIGILTAIGVADDRFDISYKVRICVQAILAILMMATLELKLSFIGNLLGFGEINVGHWGYALTILAVLGSINAFNMVDGIDGLLGGLSTVSFGSLAYLFASNGYLELAGVCIAIICTLIPYVAMNLGLFGKKRKVFMGDSGSMVIGFTAIWLLLEATQMERQVVMRPVTALWLIALPLMDMAAIMARRIKRGDSPFKPDREHLHHIFQRAGLNSRQTLTAICSISLFFAAIGIVGENYGVAEHLMFIAFIAVFSLYYLTLAHIWRVLTFFRRLLKKDTLSYQEDI